MQPFSRTSAEGRRPRRRLTLVYLPISFSVESHLQQTVLGIVPLASAGAGQITAPGCALMIVIFRHRKRGSATAGDEEHAQRRFLFRTLFGLALTLHDSSTVA